MSVEENINDKKDRRTAAIHFFVWCVLIIAGILVKRVYHRPELMMVFHLPAAVFLVLGMRKVSGPIRKHFQMEKERYQARASENH